MRRLLLITFVLAVALTVGGLWGCRESGPAPAKPAPGKELKPQRPRLVEPRIEPLPPSAEKAAEAPDAGTGAAAAPTAAPDAGTAAPAAAPDAGTAAPAAAPDTGTAAPAAAPDTGTAAPAAAPDAGTEAPAAAPPA